MDIDRLYLLAGLNSLCGVGIKTFRKLVDYFGDVENIFAAGFEDLLQVKGVGQKVASNIKAFNLEKFAEREERLIDKEGAFLISLENERYPKQLKSIYDPPYILYVKGELKKKDVNSIAVVGSRRATSYGRFVIDRFIPPLVNNGLTIVSGMARGIDSCAHKKTISSNGRTIAVLGCGLDITYPPENKELKEQIAANGAVISEFSMSTKPDKMNFPKRNRIISGLSVGTLVVEAAEKSGSLITADFALDQGRDVFAVPGNINAVNSSGCNKLIKVGAKLTETVDDILEEMPGFVQKPVSQVKRNKFEDLQLSDIEKRLLSLIATRECCIDELIGMSDVSPPKVMNAVTRLELAGAVKKSGGKVFLI